MTWATFNLNNAIRPKLSNAIIKQKILNKNYKKRTTLNLTKTGPWIRINFYQIRIQLLFQYGFGASCFFNADPDPALKKKSFQKFKKQKKIAFKRKKKHGDDQNLLQKL